MSGVSPWLLAAVFAATTIASVLTGGEYRWLNVAVSAGIVSAVITAALMTRDGRQKLWMIAGVLSLAGSLTMAAVYYWQQSACTATNASGERVVIGTELTEQGRKYLLANPGDDNNVILESLGGSRPELAWTEASIWRCRLILASTGALWIPLFGVAAIAAVAVVVAGARPARRKGPRRVFLSYNHEDAAAAAELKRFLAGRDIEVTIDTERMAAGQRIEDFIDQSICDSDVVVSLVSNRSLLSAWVAMETIQGLSRSRWVEGKLFIACYLNDDFFRPEYRLECTRKIDERLKEIEELIPQYRDQKIDTIDLNDEKTRLYELRNNLGTILATLKDSLCLDIRADRMRENGERLAAAIQSAGSGVPRSATSPPTRATLSVCPRADQ